MRVGVRDYDPGLGRFLSVDPVLDVADPVQWNPYVYADNSPVTKSDPSGLRPVDFTAEMWKAHKAARSHGASRARADAAAFGTPSGRAGGNAHVSRRGISSALLRRLGLSSYEDAEANVRAATRWNRLPDPGPLPPTHAEQVGPIGTVVEVLATAAVVVFAPEVVASVVANPWAVVTAIADSYAGGSMLAGSAGAAVGSAALRYEANLTTNAGPRALLIGPWGQRVVNARGKLPSSWGPGIPNSKKVGTKWFDPAAPKANGVRIDQGDPGSSFPSQQVDHVIVRSGGNVLGPDGLPITGSIKQNPQAHIPLDDWLTWTSWNAP